MCVVEEASLNVLINETASYRNISVAILSFRIWKLPAREGLRVGRYSGS
jgi:hypothetical protein